MTGSRETPGFVYTGRDNLVAMRAAVRYNRFLTALVESHAPPEGRWLDFGAGEGLFARHFLAQGRDIAAVEADEHLAQANREGGLATWQHLDDVPDGSVAYVYSLNVLEHIDQEAAVLSLLHRKLAPGGRLFLYVPAFQLLYSSMDRLVGHHRRYTRDSLTRAVARAGFEPLRSRYADSLGFFASLAYKLMPRADGTVSSAQVGAYDRYAFPLSRQLDALCSPWLGKNVWLAARRPPD